MTISGADWKDQERTVFDWLTLFVVVLYPYLARATGQWCYGDG